MLVAKQFKVKNDTAFFPKFNIVFPLSFKGLTYLIQAFSEKAFGFVAMVFERNGFDFQEYILIAQGKVLIQKFFRIKEEQWEIEDFDQLEQKIKFKSVPTEISVHDIYKKVQFVK